MKTVLIFVLFLFSSVSSKKKPVVSPFAFPSSLISGQRVVITCSLLEGDPPLSVYWMKDGERVKTSSTIEELILPDLGSTLVFRSVSRDHSGLYSCIGLNIFGNSSFSSEMFVNVSPYWLIKPNKNQEAILGSNIRFDCKAQGFPLPIIRWKAKKGSDVIFRALSSNHRLQNLENGSLALKSVAIDDQGLYQCEANNNIGNDISITISLIVRVSAHFKTTQLFKTVVVNKDDEIVVECEAFGEKPLKITWSSDVIQRFSLYERETPVESLVSRLTTARAQRSDSSLFTCLASNRFGQSEQRIQVIVEEVPDPVQSLKCEEILSKSVSIKWEKPSFNGNRIIERYLIELESRVLETRDTHVTLDQLEAFKEYRVSVYAINSKGMSLPSYLSFKTEEESPSLGVNDVIIQTISSKELLIKWKYFDKKIKGFLIGFKEENEEKDMNFNSIENKFSFNLINLKKNTKYLIIIQPFNNKGVGPQSKAMIGKTFPYDEPNAPILTLMNTSDVTIIKLSWTISLDNPFEGFRLYFRINRDDFKLSSLELSSNQRTINYSIECGNSFHFYLIAFNSRGDSRASTIVSKDLTHQPIGVIPKQKHFLNVNKTRVDLNLNTWTDTCKINWFSVSYRVLSDHNWIVVSERVSREAILTINGLQSSVWYCLLISAHFSQKVFTEKQFVFSTLTPEGGTVSPMTLMSSSERRFSKYIIVLIPVTCAVSVLLVIAFVVIYICFKKTNPSLTQNSLSMNEIKKEKEDNEYDFPQKCSHSHHCY